MACYDSSVGGHFRAHRDNTTKGTAHRQFAVSINLNTEEFEGGQLWFPEFGRRAYRPSTGGAVVFSCSLMHEATPVTKGFRYAYLPFLYNEEGARIRQANLQFLAKKRGSSGVFCQAVCHVTVLSGSLPGRDCFSESCRHNRPSYALTSGDTRKMTTLRGIFMSPNITTANEQAQRITEPSIYEAQLRATPTHEIKAEYITQIGKGWDDLPRPKIESAIRALVQHRLKAIKAD